MYSIVGAHNAKHKISVHLCVREPSTVTAACRRGAGRLRSTHPPLCGLVVAALARRDSPIVRVYGRLLVVDHDQKIPCGPQTLPQILRKTQFLRYYSVREPN